VDLVIIPEIGEMEYLCSSNLAVVVEYRHQDKQDCTYRLRFGLQVE